MRRTVIKVQRPLFPVDGPALVYNQDRSIWLQCRLPNRIIDEMGDNVRAYYWIDLDNFDSVDRMFCERAPEQTW